VAAALSLLVTRGILLWIVVPLGFLAWVVLTPWLRARRVPLGQFLGWIDNNLIAGLERSVLRPLFRHPPQPWIRARDIEQVRHRVGWLSFY
jgi:hypothetical protein